MVNISAALSIVTASLFTGCSSGTAPYPNQCSRDVSYQNITLTGGLNLEQRGNWTGTLGITVHESLTGKPMVLTNCHVVADASCSAADTRFREIVSLYRGLGMPDLQIGRLITH